jgi:hypothetical protein
MMMLHSAVIGTISNGCSTCGEGERRGEHLHARHDLERLLDLDTHFLMTDAIIMQSACNQHAINPPGHPLPRCPRRCTQSTRPRGQLRSATSRPRARRARSRSTARGCAPACNEGGHQWPSVAISGYQWQSVAIGGHQWPSVAIGGNRWLSVAIGGYQWLSVEISGNRWLSVALSWQSVAIRGHHSTRRRTT